METKKIIIGGASGLVANTIIQNSLRSSWAKIGVNYSQEAVANRNVTGNSFMSIGYRKWLRI